MIVIVLTACPEGLRGHLTRWLMEISAGVYVGRVSRRVREELWQRVTSMIGNGRALLVYSARNEQGLEVKTFGHHWVPEDLEGVTLMRRPRDDASRGGGSTGGWSAAARRRRYGRRR